MRHALLKLTVVLFLIAVKCYAQPAKILQTAYQKKSVSQLDNFFKAWSKDVQPINAEELSAQSDVVQQSYKVFTAFYQPFDIAGIGGSEFGDKFYDKAKYLIIQNSISVYTRDKIFYSEAEREAFAVDKIINSNLSEVQKAELLKRTDGKLSESVLSRFSPDRSLFSSDSDSDRLVIKVKNFRPIINGQGRIPLYLNAKYDTTLNAFLGNTHLPLGAGGIMNPARSNGESAKRQKFLENFIKIWYGHWGGYWQLNSYPSVSQITFDREMIYAQVYFRMIYEGGEAILKNENGTWVILSSKRTWIE